VLKRGHAGPSFGFQPGSSPTDAPTVVRASPTSQVKKINDPAKSVSVSRAQNPNEPEWSRMQIVDLVN
jgi:hypothetical protein